MIHPIYISVAVDQNFGIGKENKLPWHFKKELNFFQENTTKTEDKGKMNMVLLGRKTWESLPAKSRPLQKRFNVVVTRNHDYKVKGAYLVNSIDEALSLAGDHIEKIFVLGGNSVFEEMIKDDRLSGIYLTFIHHSFDCDSYFPKIPPKFSKKVFLGKDEEKGISFEYWLYTKE